MLRQEGGVLLLHYVLPAVAVAAIMIPSELLLMSISQGQQDHYSLKLGQTETASQSNKQINHLVAGEGSVVGGVFTMKL